MAKDYVEQIEGGAFRVTGSRVSLDSIVTSFLEGLSPESIAENFPVLSLEQVYGAIAFYLANQQSIDDYLQQGRALTKDLRSQWEPQNAALSGRLRRIRDENQVSGGR